MINTWSICVSDYYKIGDSHTMSLSKILFVNVWAIFEFSISLPYKQKSCCWRSELKTLHVSRS